MASVALVIPAWDEAKAIEAVLDEIPPHSVDQVWVVVRHAYDPTAELARSRGAEILVQGRRGYGAACHAGAQAAMASGATIVAFLDGDYSDPPAALPHLIDPILRGDADISLGYRQFARGLAALPLHARLGNAAVVCAANLLVGSHLSDLPSFKVIRSDCLRRLEMREMTYGWTVEMLVKAARAGLRCAEVSVDYRPRLGGRSKVSGTVRGTLGAAWKLCMCTLMYARWRPATERTLAGASS
jgi:glycosyltransferase involved in cell wall biosynthesis